MAHGVAEWTDNNPVGKLTHASLFLFVQYVKAGEDQSPVASQRSQTEYQEPLLQSVTAENRSNFRSLRGR